MKHRLSPYRLTITVCFVFTLVFFVASPTAQESIQGAFGIKFGDSFDKNQAVSIRIFIDNKVLEFIPEVKTTFLELFDRFYLSVTPKTNQVYGICGVVSSKNTKLAKKQHTSILQRLERRYGDFKSGLLSSVANLFGIKEIKKGARRIVVAFKEAKKRTYVIFYDIDLKELAQQEESQRRTSFGPWPFK